MPTESMPTTENAPTTGSPTPEKSGLKRLAFATSVGTSLEFYDFAIYGTATALVFTDTFFKTDDAWFSTFMGLATFGIGFLMAPIGAVLFGWVGDTFGRRRALQLTFVGMGAATVLIGVLPTYAQVGITAPVMLVLLRLVHGLCRGGETGGSAVLAIEHAPDNQRALYGVFTALGSPMGSILANGAFALVLLLPDDAVQSWAWRIPFLAGGVVLLLGIWIRHGVHESPVFQQMVAERDRAERDRADTEQEEPARRVPALQVLRTHWRRVLLAAGANIGLNSTTFVLAIFILSYATSDAPEGLELPRTAIVWACIAGLVLHGVANVISAIVSDRIGRRPVMIAGGLLCVASALITFRLAEIGTVGSVAAALCIGFTVTGVLFGPMYTYFTELFPRDVRQTGMGIAYHVGAVLGGGISPMIANRIMAETGEAMNIGYYLATVCALGVVCMLMLPETAPVRARRTARARVESGVPVIG